MMEDSAGEGRAEVAERKIRMKYEKEAGEAIEEDEYGEELESSSDSESDGDKIEEEADTDPEQKVEVSDEDDEELDQYLDKVYALKKRRSEQIEGDAQKAEPADEELESGDSIEIIDSDNADAVAGDFEHLSNFDPDDQSLQSERSFSIIDSVVSGASMGVESFTSAGFSIVSKDTVQSVRRAPIHPSRDVYAEDIVTQKIIYYISLFSDEVKVSLGRLKDKGLLKEYKQ